MSIYEVSYLCAGEFKKETVISNWKNINEILALRNDCDKEEIIIKGTEMKDKEEIIIKNLHVGDFLRLTKLK